MNAATFFWVDDLRKQAEPKESHGKAAHKKKFIHNGKS